jgi:hypothetical protein
MYVCMYILCVGKNIWCDVIQCRLGTFSVTIHCPRLMVLSFMNLIRLNCSDSQLALDLQFYKNPWVIVKLSIRIRIECWLLILARICWTAQFFSPLKWVLYRQLTKTGYLNYCRTVFSISSVLGAELHVYQSREESSSQKQYDNQQHLIYIYIYIYISININMYKYISICLNMNDLHMCAFPIDHPSSGSWYLLSWCGDQ